MKKLKYEIFEDKLTIWFYIFHHDIGGSLLWNIFFFFYIFSISKSKIIFELSFSCGSYRTRLARFCSNNMASQLPHDIYTTQRCLEIRMSSSSSTSDKDTGFSADYKVYSGSASIATSCRRFDSTFFFFNFSRNQTKIFLSLSIFCSP